jgi:adenylylsulfate kinase-like enzyme
VTRVVVITGPIAAGKNTAAEALAERIVERGRTVVVVDLDDVAAMVGPPGAAAAGLWFAAHQAHGALVGQWARTAVDLVVAVGPVFTTQEQAALTGFLPEDARLVWVLVEAPVEVTLARAQADLTRRLSREREFHLAAHARYRAHRSGIPYDLLVDSSATGVQEIAVAVESTLAF